MLTKIEGLVLSDVLSLSGCLRLSSLSHARGRERDTIDTIDAIDTIDTIDTIDNIDARDAIDAIDRIDAIDACREDRWDRYNGGLEGGENERGALRCGTPLRDM